MDPCAFNIDTASELRLRRHLRDILLPYARIHLTSDHAAFTENAVEELLLQTLEHVPMADATSFLLPTEPLQVFIRSLGSLDLAPPEEKWVVTSEHMRYLRTLSPPLHPQDLPTEKCWYDDNHYTKLSPILRPMSSPILSKRTRRETPKPGSTNSRAHIPRTNSALTAFLSLKYVSVQNIEDLPVPPMGDVLDLRLKLDSVTDAEIRKVLQAALVPAARDKSISCSDGTSNVSEFLRHHSPPWCLPSLDSPPLFPRIARASSTTAGVRGNTMGDVGHPTRVSDLASMFQVASPELIEGENDDIDDHHMEVATTSRFSSPPLPSPNSSDRGGFDEPWNISPPETPATSLIATKMDEVEIPRIRRFGHKNTLVHESTNDSGTADLLRVTKRLVEDPSLSPGFFITSFISAPIPTMTQALRPITSQLEGVKSGMHPPPPFSPGQSTSNSLLGQPPSVSGEQADREILPSPDYRVGDFEEQPFDDVVAGIYLSTPQDPHSYIKGEKLTDKDTMLMDVPNLPPPTAHPKPLALFPEDLQGFVTPKGEPSRLDTPSHGSSVFGLMAFLKPVKGIKPLALDLSWKPFNFGKTIPTDEEVAGVTQPIQPEGEIPGYRDENYEKAARVLLDLGNPPISAEGTQLAPDSPRGCKEFGTSPATRRIEQRTHVEYLLTRRERIRASGTNISVETGLDARDEVDIEQGISPHSDNNEHGGIPAQVKNQGRREKRQSPPRPSDATEHSSRGGIGCDYSFDDSGINIMDNNSGHSSTSESGVPLLLRPLQNDVIHAADTAESNQENVEDQSENKENVLPRDVHDCQLTESQFDPEADPFDWNNYFQFPASGTPPFEPLSFASQRHFQRPPDDSTNPRMQDATPLTPSPCRVKHAEIDLVSTSECEHTNARATKRRRLDDLVPASSKDLFTTFIGLRNQAACGRTLGHSETGNDTPIPYQTQGLPEQLPPRVAPDDVFDQHTVCLPEHWIPAASVHRYLASMALIQKRALVRELQGYHCRVVLVERYELGGTDIIVDPDYGILFIPLLALPAQLESVVERISRESWCYLNLLAIFEAFPSAQSYRADHAQDARPAPYAYTPPICKAIKKLRRNLGIAEGCGTMNPRCTISWAFANDVEEGAKFVRCFGEEACAISTERGNEMLWGEREWLEEEEQGGESDLARVHGMNAFAAFVMLYNRSLETILELPPETRLTDFGQLLGRERMAELNAIIEGRMQQVSPAIAESVVSPRY